MTQEPLLAEVVPMNNIRIAISDMNGKLVGYSLKPTTFFAGVMLHYAKQNGHDVHKLRFLFNGRRIRPQDTPAMLGIEDQNQLDVFLEQVGG